MAKVMKSLIPTAENEFDDSPDIFARIKTALHISIARPYGRKLASLTDYFNRFTDEQLNVFVDRLSESKWVRNDQCTYDFIMRKDLVTEILSGGMPESVSKYYNIVILEV
jgi:hypothetical protein